MEESKQAIAAMPQVAPGHILLKNPVTVETSVEVDKATAKLPPKEKEAYMRKEFANLWQSVEVVAVGNNCNWIEVGDKIVGNQETIESMTSSPSGDYVVVRESVIKMKW